MRRRGSRLTAFAAVLVVLCGITLTQRWPALRGGQPAGRYSQRLVILGIDGMEPALVTRWMKTGKLPNIRRLAEQGGLYPLATTHSPQSAPAWASFATGVNPGKHNIYDAMTRDASTYRPRPATMRAEPGRFLFDYIPYRKPKLSSTRGATSFWVTAGTAGVRSSIVAVPGTFPPEHVPHGEMLSGFPLPDIRGTSGTFHYFATDVSANEERDAASEGIVRRLVVENDIARSELVGPPNPVGQQQVRENRVKSPPDGHTERSEGPSDADMRIPFRIRWNRSAKTATAEIAGSSIPLQSGQISRWIDLEFRANFFVRLHGMAQMLLLNADDELQLYVSPINWKPDNPPFPMSSPESLSRELFEFLGHYRTLGWAEATAALNENRVDERTFMEDLYRAFDDRAQLILNRVDARNWDVLVGVIDSTDRVQHMMWRFLDPAHPMYDEAQAAQFGDSIERVYRRADQFVGELVDHLEPGTAVLIVSDHGFHSWRKSVDLNAWLVDQGYMAVTGEQSDDRAPRGEVLANVDWGRTRAYAMGTGQIYLNLRGREGRGIVNPGVEAALLADELCAKLLTLTDPDDGARIVRAVYQRDDIYTGEYAMNAPDVQVGMADGYHVPSHKRLVSSHPGTVYPNMQKWSGDHAGFDFAGTPGVLITNRPVRRRIEELSIMDVAPTVLHYFGLEIPSDIDGKPLF
jgi:predicted AlkP superfamily phosphohydrolase/phosphomutase